MLDAQITATTYADPDSTPDSDTDTIEDDEATLSLYVRELTAADTLITATEPVMPPGGQNIIYPNPSNDEFLFMAETDITTLRLNDMLGREHFSRDTIRSGEQIRFGSQLATGYYLLTIQYKTGNQRTVKLLKLGH